MSLMSKNTRPGMHLGFDMDGVILDHAANKIQVAGEFGYIITAEQTPSDILKDIIPKAAREKLQEAIYHDSDVAFKALLMRGVKPALRELVKRGIPFTLISRRKNPEFAVRILEKHGLWPVFFNKQNSFFVDRPEDKNKIAAEIGVTHYLDDECAVLERLVDVPNRFLFDKHRIFPETSYYKKVHSWMEFIVRI